MADPRQAISSVRRRARGSAARAFGLLAFLPLAERVPTYARLIWALAQDDRTPGQRKALLAGALGYVLLGRDIVPDRIPILGQIDDFVVVALAVDLFLDGVPDDLLQEKLDDLAIDRLEFDEDVIRIRRLTPGPIRRTIRRIPDVIALAADGFERTGIGPRIRDWINKEESLA